MIKLTSFYPFAGFLRITQEFYEDKFIVKTKSLMIEHEKEYSYKLIATISDSYRPSGGQEIAGFLLLVGLAYAFRFFCNPIYANPILLGTLRVLFFAGILMFASGFIKRWHVYFLDRDGQVITYINLNHRNKDAVSQVTDMIMSHVDNIDVISAADPFPESKYIHEHVYFNFSVLTKTTDRFYNDRIIGFQKSPFAEYVYTIKYNELNGNEFKGKNSDKVFGPAFSFGTFILAVAVNLYRGFNILPRMFLMNIFYAYIILLAASFIVQFIKRRSFGFYGKDERIRYWAFSNKTEKEKIETIIKFVQSKIPTENKEASLKE
jgi:hypothetical protein